MWRTTVALAIALAALAVASGCCGCSVSTGWGTPYKADNVALIEVGRTTRAEVLALLGGEYIQDKDPDVIRYEQGLTSAKAGLLGCRCQSGVVSGVRVRFKDDVVAGCRLLGAR